MSTKLRRLKHLFYITPFFCLTSLILIGCGGGGGGGSDTPIPDTTAPQILSTSPVAGTTGIAINTTVSVTFNEKLDPDSVDTDSITISGGSGISGTTSLSADGLTLVFTPATDFGYSTTYTVNVDGSVTDLSDNSLGDDQNFDFTTGNAPDTTAPEIEAFIPVDGATGFNVASNPSVDFNEAMNQATINNTNIKLYQGTNEIAVVVSYDAVNFRAVINPDVDLDAGTVYQIRVSTGVADAANNYLVASDTSDFTTLADTISPTVSSHTPVPDATGIAINSNITITFSERLDQDTVNGTNITVVKISDSSSVAGTVSYDDVNRIVTFDPTASLEAGPTTYRVTVTTGVTDRYGNHIETANSWLFTTTDGSGPTVNNTSPDTDETGSSTNGNITITFSEAINSSTITSANIAVVENGGSAVTGSWAYDSGTMTAEFTPAYPLDYEKTYTVTVDTDVTDTTGNHLASNYVWSFTTKDRHWTIMYYGDADCNLESALMADIAEMKLGYVDDQGLDVIILIDRHPSSTTGSGYSADTTTLGQNFTDTRLYRITNGKARRIGGSTQFSEITTTSNYEANMGYAGTLQKFIRFCKANYPAENYALIFSNHGGGSRRPSQNISTRGLNTKATISKDICYDESSSNDCLFTAEITDYLEASDSVNLYGMDACLMSTIEYAYQFRTDNGDFHADILVASAPLETGNGWQYTQILNRFRTTAGNNGQTDLTLGGNETYFNPATMTAINMGAVIVEEQRDSTITNSSQSLTCLDLSQVTTVKTYVDAMAVKLVSENEKSDFETMRGEADDSDLSILHYFDEHSIYSDSSIGLYDGWADMPFFDLYNLAQACSANTNFSSAIRSDASSIVTAVNALVLYSFGNSDFTGFVEGSSGVHIFCPDGDSQYWIINEGITYWFNYWYPQRWYNSLYLPLYETGVRYGSLSWCINGRNITTNAVGNWFEMLDSWYDTQLPNDADGGFNHYQW